MSAAQKLSRVKRATERALGATMGRRHARRAARVRCGPPGGIVKGTVVVQLGSPYFFLNFLVYTLYHIFSCREEFEVFR